MQSADFARTSTDLKQRLQTLFRGDAAAASRRWRAPYDAAEIVGGRPIILFGCGPLGRRTAAGLLAAGRPAQAFIDNNPAHWGKAVEGLLVLSPQQAMKIHGKNALYVVAIYNGSTVRAQLTGLGCVHVLHIASLYSAFPLTMLPHCTLADPGRTLACAAEASAALNLWADTASRREYVSQLGWRLGDDSLPLSAPHPMSELYLASDLFRLDERDVIVDCGAFDGDSLKVLLSSTTHTFGSFIGLEPDPRSFSMLSDYVSKLSADVRIKIELFQRAVASEAGSLRFRSTGSVVSRTDGAGEVIVSAETLDHLVGARNPTFIKMDIEGQELDALRGATEILGSSNAILAISLYHKPEDLWQIPTFIHAVCPGHHLYLRRYAEDCWETVCYAIPASRIRQVAERRI